jgi:hypothetical protein
VVYAATAADVREVVVDGRTVVHEGRHLSVPDVGAALTRAITRLTQTPSGAAPAPSPAGGVA